MQRIFKRLFVQLSSPRLASAAALCATLLVASSALAQEVVVAPPSSEAPPVASIATPQTQRFGRLGQWFLSAETFWLPLNNSAGGNTSNVSVSWDSQSASGSPFNLSLQPVVGYFFTEVIFGRLGLNISYGHISGQDNVGVGVAPGIGLALPVAPKIEFAPWVGVNYMYSHLSENSVDVNQLNLEVHVPLVFDLADHFAITAGVYYAQGLVNHESSGSASADLAKTGTVGLTTGLLGYW